MLRAASLADGASPRPMENTIQAPRSRSCTFLPARSAPIVQCSIM